MSIEAMKMALEFLEAGNFVYPAKLAEDLRQAITEAEQAQPVAWLKTWNSVGNARTGMQRVDLAPECETWLANMFPTITPLYTAPPPRQPLTDEEIKAVIATIDPDEQYLPTALRQFARAIEAAHGIKK